MKEDLLQELNLLFGPLEEELIKRFSRPKFPVVFIIGAPRSGHTLLSQLLAVCGGFGYVDNFVAGFWMAPYIGAKIELASGLRDAEKKEFIYESEYGRTRGWIGPHEFGNFLRRWLPLGDTHKVESDDLPEDKKMKFVREVAALEAVYKKPIFFRNIIYGLNMRLLLKLFPKAIFVVCKRNVIFQAQSILIARQEVAGSKQKWWSLRPREYPQLKCLPYWRQVVAQIYYTHQAIEEGLFGMAQRQCLEIRYEALVAQPREQIERVVEAVERCGTPVEWYPDAIPKRLQSRDVQRINDEDFHKLEEAAEEYFGTAGTTTSPL